MRKDPSAPGVRGPWDGDRDHCLVRAMGVMDGSYCPATDGRAIWCVCLYYCGCASDDWVGSREGPSGTQTTCHAAWQGLEWPHRMPGNKWTQEKIINEIQRLHERGVDLSPTGIRRTHGALFSSARSQSHFGSWRAAVTAAGLDYSRIKRGEQIWSKDRIVRAIRKHYEQGKDLLSAEFKRANRQLYSAACAKRYFGSWRRAVEAAGLDYDRIRGRHFWSRETIIAQIRDLHAAGKSLSWSSINRHNPGLYRAARRRENFGSWRAALRAAGVEQVSTSTPKRWTRRRIIEEIQAMHRQGQDLSQKAVMASNGALLSAAKSARYFGTWREAVEAAGIDYDTVRHRRGRHALGAAREARGLSGEAE